MSEQRAPQHGKYPIDRPCSACSAGDYKMEYHDHDAPFREVAAASLPESQPSPSGDACKVCGDLAKRDPHSFCSACSPLDIINICDKHKVTSATSSQCYICHTDAKVSGQAEKRLREALQQCAIKFREYATIHGQKEDTHENREKVKANLVMAELAEAALQESPSE